MTFRVAIVGRPNVGKSTLFNRLVGRRAAIVDDTPGVTRDRREGHAQLGDLLFTVIDTAGYEDGPAKTMEAQMREQTSVAIADADVVLFLFDARAGVTPLDRHFAAWLRKANRKVVPVANKCEAGADVPGISEAERFGFGEPIPLSAEHGEGLAELHSLLRRLVPDDAVIGNAEEEAALDAAKEPQSDADRAIRVAIIGRPNVGKSTLINALLGQERVLTGPEPGVTRDSIEIPWASGKRKFVLIDTAGLRKKARIDDRLEQMSTADTIRTIRAAQVTVLVLDATVMLEKQDLAIARLAIEEGRAMVVVANKWDLVDDPAAAHRKLRDRLEISLPQVAGVQTVTVSALHGRKLDDLLKAVVQSHDIWNTDVSTPKLNRWLSGVTEAHPPPLVGGRRPRLRFMRQVAARPPTFAIFGNKLTTLPDDYTRYLANGLRDTFDMPGTVIRLVLRQSENPYDPKD